MTIDFLFYRQLHKIKILFKNFIINVSTNFSINNKILVYKLSFLTWIKKFGYITSESKVGVSECVSKFVLSFLLGGASLYCFFSRRRKINARDLIVITGCNSGLGYSLAIHCRAKGAMVLAGVRETAMTNPNAAVEVLKNKGVIIHHLDITNEQSTRDFQDKVKSLLKERQLGERCKRTNDWGKYVGIE